MQIQMTKRISNVTKLLLNDVRQDVHLSYSYNSKNFVTFNIFPAPARARPVRPPKGWILNHRHSYQVEITLPIVATGMWGENLYSKLVMFNVLKWNGTSSQCSNVMVQNADIMGWRGLIKDWLLAAQFREVSREDVYSPVVLLVG